MPSSARPATRSTPASTRSSPGEGTRSPVVPSCTGLNGARRIPPGGGSVVRRAVRRGHRAGRWLLPGRDRRPRRPRRLLPDHRRPRRCRRGASRRHVPRSVPHEPAPAAAPGPRGRVGAAAAGGAREGDALARGVPPRTARGRPPARHRRTPDPLGRSRLVAAGRLGRGARHRRPVHRVGRAGRRLLPRRDRRPCRPAAPVRRVRRAR